MKKYIFRNEGGLVFSGLRQRTNTGGKRFDLVYQSAWTLFIEELENAIHKAIPTADIRFHELMEIEDKKRKLIGADKVISLDSYCQIEGSIHLGVSRHFNFGGIKNLGLGERPGYAPIKDQIKKIFKDFPGEEFVLVEDDIFSGKTISKTVKELRAGGVRIKKVVAGIKVTNHEELAFKIEAIHNYDHVDVFDLCDPRDFAFGLFEAGLVLRMGKALVRAPYILPFVSPAARASIPLKTERQFSRKVIQANINMFSEIQSGLGFPLQLKHLDKSFCDFMVDRYKIDPGMGVLEACSFISSQLDDYSLR